MESSTSSRKRKNTEDLLNTLVEIFPSKKATFLKELITDHDGKDVEFFAEILLGNKDDDSSHGDIEHVNLMSQNEDDVTIVADTHHSGYEEVRASAKNELDHKTSRQDSAANIIDLSQGEETLSFQDVKNFVGSSCKMMPRLLEIFPHVCPLFLKNKAQEFGEDEYKFEEFVNNNIGVSTLPSRDEYDAKLSKENNIKKILKMRAIDFLEEFDDEVSDVYMDTSSPVSEAYKDCCIKYLKKKFTHVDEDKLKRILERHNFHLTPTFKSLMNVKSSAKGSLVHHVEENVPLANSNLDLHFLKEYVFLKREPKIQQLKNERLAQRATKIEECRENGLLMECCFCYNECPLDEISYCSKDDMLCRACVKEGARLQIEHGETRITCFLQNCYAEIELETLKRVLVPRMYKKLLDVRTCQDMMNANIENLFQCPGSNCNFVCILAESDNLIHCGNPDCRKISCKFCKKENHLPLRCDEEDAELSPTNSVWQTLETHLLRLALISDVKPRRMCAAQETDQQPAKQQSENYRLDMFRGEVSGLFPNNKMAKGVGYSSGMAKTWDTKAYLALQKEKDKQLLSVLSDVISELKKVGNNSCDESLYSVVEGSALVPFIESKLQDISLLEIDKHVDVYKKLVQLISALKVNPILRPLLGPLPNQKTSIHCLLVSLEKQANIMLSRIGTPQSDGKQGQKCKSYALADTFHTLAKEVEDCLPVDVKTELGGNSEESRETVPTSVISNPNNTSRSSSNDEENQQYCHILKHHQFRNFEFSGSGPNHHSHYSRLAQDKSYAPKTIKRIALDIASLSTSLPLNCSSSIYVVCDDNNTPLLRAIITGPEGTPYTGGIYEFDIFFPSRYPVVPPMVQFRTTGGGKVRFNPNLYACGKVCLSLLGTWQGEKWNKETSTVLQVLVSIQGLILCAEPYYNEPGCQCQFGTYQGKTASKNYSEQVFKNNLKVAIISAIRKPPAGFKEAVNLHFYLKRDQLIKELEKQSQAFSNTVKKDVEEVKTLLQSLKKPKILDNI